MEILYVNNQRVPVDLSEIQQKNRLNQALMEFIATADTVRRTPSPGLPSAEWCSRDVRRDLDPELGRWEAALAKLTPLNELQLHDKEIERNREFARKVLRKESKYGNENPTYLERSALSLGLDTERARPG